MPPRGRSSRRASELQQQAIEDADKPVVITCHACEKFVRTEREPTPDATMRKATRMLYEHFAQCEDYQRLYGDKDEPDARHDLSASPGDVLGRVEGNAGAAAVP